VLLSAEEGLLAAAAGQRPDMAGTPALGQQLLDEAERLTAKRAATAARLVPPAS
jgi:hypothetical protein